MRLNRALRLGGDMKSKPSMKAKIFHLIVCLSILSSASSFAAVHYVDANNATPAPPYLAWATAATAIQDAVDASSSGDEVMVTNGVYSSGGRGVDGTMTNRAAGGRGGFPPSGNS